MSERTRNGKEFGQDGIGVLFCLVGGFFAVSIVLLLNGQESKAGVRFFTWPVVELVGLLGATSALLASVALAGLGSWLFLRPTPFSAMRPLVALLVGVLGLTLALGAFGIGGSLGGWLPGLVQGFAGRTLDAVLGLALVWLGWTLLPTGSAARRSPSEALRMGLASRGETGAGVSPAEAALLVTPRPPARREEPVTRPAPARPDPAPAREEPLRPVAAPKEVPAKRVEAQPVRPVAAAAAPAVRPLASPPVAPPAPREEPAPVEGAIPPAPSWESSDDTLPLEAEAPYEEPQADERELAAERDDADPFAAFGEGSEEDFEEAFDEDSEEDDLDGADESEEEDEPSLASGAAESREAEPVESVASGAGIDASLSVLAETFETEEAELESEETEDVEPEEELSEPEPTTQAAPPAPLRAAWEQVGLFDEEEAEEEEEEAAAPAARGDLTPTFDFDSDAPRRVLHEPEAVEEPSFPAAPAPKPVETPRQPAMPVAKAPVPEPVPEPARDFLIQPAPAPAPKASPRAPKTTPKPEPKPAPKAAAKAPPREEPVVTPDEPGEGWNQLVYEAGCAILEQQRVAVSMLERRFGLDFDSACRVLDELQNAGLIGPYMGGRTRDILLTREEWLPHAPHAS